MEDDKWNYSRECQAIAHEEPVSKVMINISYILVNHMGKSLAFQPKVRLEAVSKINRISREKVEKLNARLKTSLAN